MNLFRSRLILGFLVRLITDAITIIYKLIKLFNLQLALLVVLIGFIVFVIAGVELNGIIFTVFVVALFLSILVAVIGTVRNLLGLNKKPEKKRRAKVSYQESPAVQPQPVKAVEAGYDYVPQNTQSFMNNAGYERPVYYRTKQNPDYIFAEFSDRYELYKMSAGQLIKIRTDYK